MIQGLLKPLLRLFALILVLIAAIVLFVKVPASHRLDIYHLDDCQLPCWIGIVPSQTTIGETLKLISNGYPISQYSYGFAYDSYDGRNFTTVTRRNDGLSLLITFNSDEGAKSQTSEAIVSQISLSAYSLNQVNYQETLFDWILEFGSPPQAFSVTMGNHWASPNVLYYQRGVRLTLTALFPDFAHVSPGIGVSGLDIYDQLERAYPLDLNNMSNNGAIPWKGWSADYHYQLLAHMLP